MQRAGEFLGRAVRRMRRPEGALSWLVAAWPEIAGAALAAHTRPVRCSKGCLEISTDGKNWRLQLEGMTREFCDRINQAWGATLVHEIRFGESSPAVLAKVSPAEDNAHTPFVRRRKPA